MKDIHTPLRSKLFEIITGKGYGCYENGAVPDDAVTPYVIISDMRAAENSDKSRFGNNVQTLLDLVTRYPKGQVAGSIEVDTMAGNIFSSINSKTKIELNNELQIVSTKILQDEKININTTTHKIYRRLIRFSQLIKEI